MRHDAHRGLAATALLIAASFLPGFPSAASATSSPGTTASANASAVLPEAPEKALVLQYCEVCHDLDWIVRSGATKEGWADRINRMIRGGATMPREQVSAVAAYLGKVLPPRPPSTAP